MAADALARRATPASEAPAGAWPRVEQEIPVEVLSPAGDEASLAIPSYDQLAAWQVVARLATWTPPSWPRSRLTPQSRHRARVRSRPDRASCAGGDPVEVDGSTCGVASLTPDVVATLVADGIAATAGHPGRRALATGVGAAAPRHAACGSGRTIRLRRHAR